MPPRKTIDQAFDFQPVHKVSPSTLKLAVLLTRLFFTEDVFRNITDCAWDNFTTIVDRMPVSDDDLGEYVDEVLCWAYAECGRHAYDRIKEVCDKALHEE